ncbi:MAG: hypothetical protein ACI8WB_001217 [Phenylobacterium sp.]
MYLIGVYGDEMLDVLMQLMSLTDLPKKKVKLLLVIILLLSVTVISLGVVHLEYSMSVSKHLPYYEEAYTLKEEKQKAIHFVDGSKTAIINWKGYYYGSLDADRYRQKARELVVSNSKSFEGIDLLVLSTTWKIWTRYFLAYQKFICADINRNVRCASKGLENVKLVEEYDVTKISTDGTEWLRSQGIFNNLKLLKAHLSAIQFNLDPSVTNKELAIEMLKELGGQRSLMDQRFHQDRILKPIYELTYTENLASSELTNSADKSN